MQLQGDDYGIFTLGRTILAKNPQACLAFFYKVTSEGSKDTITESNFWDKLAPNTGIMFDHHRQDIAQKFSNYPLFPVQALSHLANEGLADSVEFRRLARKYIRRAKQHNLDQLFFPEAIFAEPKTHKTLQHLAGTQLKIQTLSPEIKSKKSAKQKITIYHDLENTNFLKARAEKLLGTKLKKSDLEII